MDWKKLGKNLLFPHTAIMLILLPISTSLLVFSMIFLGTESVISYISYALAAYTLTVWCFRIPRIIAFMQRFKKESKYARRWLEDAHLRLKVSLYCSLLWNIVYAIFQLGLGFYHKTFWFCSLSAYYICLAVMRFFLVRHTKRYAPGEKLRAELNRARTCGWIFLVMNIALSLIVFFMLYWNRTFQHNMITAIAMAAYTFTAFTVAIVNIVKQKRNNSPVVFASKAINLAAACVSMLTLTSTLLTTFGNDTMDASAKKLMLGCVGFAVSGVVLSMAIYMIVQNTNDLKKQKQEVQNANS